MDYNNLSWDEIYNLIKENKMELLGYANGWSTTPPKVKEAHDKGYKYYGKGI